MPAPLVSPSRVSTEWRHGKIIWVSSAAGYSVTPSTLDKLPQRQGVSEKKEAPRLCDSVVGNYVIIPI